MKTIKLSKAIAMLMTICVMFSLCFPVMARTSESQTPSSYKSVSHVGDRAKASLSKQRSVTTYILGDVNLDGVLNTSDATTVLRFSSDLIQINQLQRKVGDANQSGSLNTGDATVILRICASLEEMQYIEIGEPEPTEPLPSDPIPSEPIPSEPVTSYLVTYYGGLEGQSIQVPAAVSVEAGTLYTVDTMNIVCDGYSFKGYKSNFDDNTYFPGNTFTMPEQDVTLTGTWEKIQPEGYPLTVTLNDIFNEVSVKTETIYLKESKVFTYSDFAENGYKEYTPGTTFNVTVGENGLSTSYINFNVFNFVNSGNREFVVISTAQGVNNIRMQCTWNFVLANDINMRSINNFVPIGWTNGSSSNIEPFTGILDGNDHEISSLCCDYWSNQNSSCIGFIAVNSGTIKNLHVFARTYEESSSMYGIFGWKNVGIICGSNEGTIEYCLAQGNCGAADYQDKERGGTAGGLCGENEPDAIIRYSGSNCGVEGYTYLGGLCGKNFSTIEQCWFAGAINTAMTDSDLYNGQVIYVGGLCGGSSGFITDCYVICMDYICAWGGVGGIVGQGIGVVITNAIVAYAYLLYTSEPNLYLGSIVGFAGSGANYPTLTNCYDKDSFASIPAGFSASVWDMNGACYPSIPDLINARRPE